MRFNSPQLLWLLLALPAGIALGWWLQKRKAKRWRMRLDVALEPLHFAEVSRSKRGVKTAFAIVGFTLCVLSLARPQYGASTVKQTRRGLDMVVAVDVSKSMLAKDLLPDRLTRAKLELSSLLDKLRGDRVGFIAFSGQAFIQCPLTNDYTAAKVFLRALDTKTIPRGGTAIAEALRTADQLLEDARQHGGAKSQIVVVMTDGEDHEGDALAAAKALKDKGVSVFTVGVGSTVGEPIPVYSEKNEFRGYMKDARGNTVLSKVNEDALKSIAEAGGGRYVASNAGSTGVEELLSDLAGYEREEHEAKFKVVYTDRFQWVLIPGALFLVLGMLISPRRAAALAFMLFATANTAEAFPWPSLQNGDIAKANEALEKGDSDEAIKGYEAAKETLGDRPELYLNEGMAQLAKKDPKAARPLLERALLSDDKAVRAKAQYLLGNASFDEKDFAKAVEHYKKSLREDGKAKDTKHNLELAQVLLKQQKEQQKKDENKDDKDKKDEKKDDKDKKDEKKDPKDQKDQKDQKDDKKDQKQDQQDQQKKEQEQQQQKQPTPAEQQQQQEKQPNERMQLLDALQAEEKPMRFDLFKAQQQKKAQRKTVEKDW